MQKKILITGHCRGIGLALHQEAVARHYQVFGYDILQGQDIDQQNVQNDITAKALEVDIFINNAYCRSQTKLLSTLLDLWAGQEKLIVNFTSKMAYLGEPSVEQKNLVYEAGQYYIDKLAQLQLARSHIGTQRLPRLMSVAPGWAKTEFSNKISGGKGMNTGSMAKMIFDLIDYTDEITVNELVIDCVRDPVLYPYQINL